MFVSENEGKDWTLAETHVESVAWDESFVPAKLIVQRQEPGGKSILRSSKSKFLSATGTVVELENVEEFEVKNDYKFATRKIDDEVRMIFYSASSSVKKCIYLLFDTKGL